MAQVLLIDRHSTGAPRRFFLKQRVVNAGSEPGHELQTGAPGCGLLFSLARTEKGTELGYELLPGRERPRINGQSFSKRMRLITGDRVEWSSGAFIYLEQDDSIGTDSPASDPAEYLRLLHNLAVTFQSAGSHHFALHQALSTWVEIAGAEYGTLVSETSLTAAGNSAMSSGGNSSWEILASVKSAGSDGESAATSRKSLLSNTILNEAIRSKAPVCVENIIGHPYADAASVIESRIFSVACFPLCVGERVFGAVFLHTCSPGRSIRREKLPDLSLLAALTALMLGNAMELTSVRRENRVLKAYARDLPSQLLYSPKTSAMVELDRKLSRIAGSDIPTLILGETGTGKEVAANEIHRRSGRAERPFIAINCAAIPASLLESTLFGHEKGAFTGADRKVIGKFQLAEGGTLFLDEIGDLDPALQAKLLRVLQEKVVEPVGGAGKPVPIDVRIISATHQKLEEAVRMGRFRSDLYYRLAGATLTLPPLRERPLDIELLAMHFLRLEYPGKVLDAGAREALLRHRWPGNIRELQGVIRRSALFAESSVISDKDIDLGTSLNQENASPTAFANALGSLEDAQSEFTRKFVEAALARNTGNRSLTAAQLGISERTLYRILSKELACQN